MLDESFEPRPGVEPDVHGWLSTGEVRLRQHGARSGSHPSAPAGSARTIRGATELSDGAVIFERTYASHEWLAREILKEAGDAVVLEPDEARRAVLEAAEHLAVTA